MEIRVARSMSSFDKAMALFGALVAQDGVFESDAMSVQLGVPESTLYRHLNALHSAGLICRSRRGRYLPNPVFLKKLEGYTPHAVLSELVRPFLDQLSVALETTTHFGLLENDMVTYLAKSVFEGEEVFTRENGQLEAYCSAIGKVLLSHMTVDERRAYISSGPFPKLTDKTITDPAEIERELHRTRIRGFGVDDGEVHNALYCIAVPVFSSRGMVVGAISSSSSQRWASPKEQRDRLIQLNGVALSISSTLGAGA